MTRGVLRCSSCHVTHDDASIEICECCPLNRDNVIHKSDHYQCDCGRILCWYCCRHIGTIATCPECGRLYSNQAV